MSTQNKKNVNTKPRKEEHIHVRVSSDLKEKIIEEAGSRGISISKFILKNVLTNIENNHSDVNTDHQNVNTNILKECILEFNKLMSYNAENIIFPEGFDKNKIIEGVNECRLI